MTYENVRAAADAAELVEIPADMLPPSPPDDGPMGEASPPFGMSDEDAPEAAAVTLPLNDFGNGKRLMQYYGRDLLFVKRLGWFRWGGCRWVADEDEIEVRSDAQKISAHILQEIPFITLEEWQREDLERWQECRGEFRDLDKKLPKDRSDEEKKRFNELTAIQAAGEAAVKVLGKRKGAHATHAKNSGNSGKTTNMLGEAKIEASTGVDSLNREKLMLNCLNGVLYFNQLRDAHAETWGDPVGRWQASLLPQAREQKISKMAQANFNPKAEAPTWVAFMERILPDPELRTFLQRWFGYSLTGLTGEQKLIFCYGIGRNGKSTMVDMIAKIMDDYGTTIPIETLTGTEQRKGSDATPDLARLPGARFVRASEPEQGTRMKEALIKALTGGEAIMIRRMHSEFVEIVPEFKLVISGNHKPEIRGADDGIWRRVMLVPFLEQIPDDEVDKNLPAKLEAERDGILAWLVQGCLDYLQHGLPVPQAVMDATSDYRTTSDPMREFLTTECTVTDNFEDFATGRDLRDAFNAWRLSQAEGVWGPRAIAMNIRDRMGVVKGEKGNSYEAAKTGGNTGYRYLIISEATWARMEEYAPQLNKPAGKS